MAIWNVLLYSAGALLALRSLVTLMAQHKQHLEQTLHLQAQQREARKTPPASNEDQISSPAASQGQTHAA